MKNIKRWISLFLSVAGLWNFGSCLSKENESEVQTAETESQALIGEPSAEQTSADSVIRFLVLGKDRKAALTDTVFIASIREQTGQISILQIPRDTYFNYTEKNYKKINGANKTLGTKKLKAMLSEALGVPIDYSIVVNLDVIPEIVDAVGGVEVNLESDLDFINEAQGINVHLPAGKNLLTGKTAEYYLRYRSGYVNADLGRMDAQKQFLQNLATSAAALPLTEQIGIAVKLIPKVKTDLPISKAVSVIKTLFGADLSSIPMATAPGTPVRGTSGAWYYSLNRKKMLFAVNTYLLVSNEVKEENFDPNRLFDRADCEAFHKIYIASGN